jgi:T4 superinfection immunity protein
MEGLFWILIILALYFLPWIIAMVGKHRQVGPIFIINLFLGWTLIGWVGALAWSAATGFEKERQ